MFCRSISIVILLFGFLAANSLNAQETETKPVETKTTGPKASIDDVKWIAGRWTGEAMGGKFEETWNPASAGTMMGMFKFIKDDTVGFYEILTIVPDGESLKLRLKHFSSDLNGWEDKDKSVEFPLVSLSDSEDKIQGFGFKKISQKEMHIVVDIKQGEQTKQENFACIRSWFNPKTSTAIAPKSEPATPAKSDK